MALVTSKRFGESIKVESKTIIAVIFQKKYKGEYISHVAEVSSFHHVNQRSSAPR